VARFVAHVAHLWSNPMTGFPEGFRIEWRGQSYRPLGTRDHTKADGSVIPVIDWETACPDCGQHFTIFTTLAFHDPRRRCDACKDPNRRVVRNAA
jgi:hypothetical protein